MSAVIDTNVLVVANGRHPPAGPHCVAACIEALETARGKKTLIDDAYRILDEYRRHCSFAGQPGVGDAFFKWLWNNQANDGVCVRVKIREHPERGFVEFPDDPTLAAFDPEDRKFVAVAIASNRSPAVLNASDTDWWQHRVALTTHGVAIDFLCPELMQNGRG